MLSSNALAFRSDKLKQVILILLLSLTSCLNNSGLPIEYDYSYDGNFKSYNTFGLMETTNSTEVNVLIEKIIRERMKFLGYKQSDRPQLLISYKIYTDSLTIYRINQPSIDEWILKQNKNLDYDRRKLTLETGTLLLLFVDKQENRAIWQGYATSPIDFTEDRSLRNAVNSILNKYTFWARGFMEKGM